MKRNKIKKFFSGILAFYMCFSIVVPARADKGNLSPEAIRIIEEQNKKKKVNVILTTDGEHDNMASMIRYLAFANEFNTKSIILTSSNAGHHSGGTVYYEPGATIMTPSNLESDYRTGETLHEDGTVASRTYSHRRWTGFTWLPNYIEKYKEVLKKNMRALQIGIEF